LGGGVGRFDDLSDLDFEELVADLATTEYELPFRAGIRGRDGGIDILAVDDEGVEHVIQCKHYKDSSNAQLRAAAKKEAEGLEEAGREFGSYRFATSRRLTHEFRKELAKILHPWVKSVNDVLGEGDLDTLLGKHSAVEGRHVKLWLAGAGPLQAILNAAAYERSAALLEETRAAVSRFVQTEAFFEARKILREKGVCVIAGTAGVGKTTLARMLMLDALEEDSMPYEISPGGLRDAWSLLSIDEPQLFYYDDFLGQTALHESRQHDTDLLRFMRKIARDPKRRFVLATREYILRQAKLLSEVLDREADEAQNFLLTIEHYSRQEKARIFYNHVYFSEQVDEQARRSLLTDRGYLEIIDHPHYNPRLIEWITGFSGHRLTQEDKQKYLGYCLSVLRSPKMLWAHAFKEGLNEAERAFLVSMLGMPRRLTEGDAQLSFEASCAARGIPVTDQRFVRVLATLDDSFISSEREGGTLYLSFINPSVIDFMRSYLRDSRPDAISAIDSACFFEQVAWLWYALAGESDAPDEALWVSFSKAFERTLTMAPPHGAMMWITRHRLIESKGGLLQTRLQETFKLVATAPGFVRKAEEWLGRCGREWLECIENGDHAPDSGAPYLAAKLAAIEKFDIRRTALSMREAIEAMNRDVDYWECVSGLREGFPDAYDDHEWEQRRMEFGEYLDYVLEEPTGYLTGSEEVGALEDLSSTFATPVPGELFDEARQEIEEAEGEADDPDRDYDDYGGGSSRGLADFGESDADIAAMFDRLDP
jgi:hypothetical protein